MDPDGREDYDSSMTENQYNKIANGFVVLEGEIKRTLNGKSWDEVQQFFQQNPNGVIYRNPDERGYKFYSNQGKDKPCEYNMYTIDMLMFYAIGKETFHIGYVLTNAIKKKIAQKSVETVLLQMTQTTTIRHGVIQGFIKGDAKKSFQNLIKYATKLKSGAYQLADGSIINFHISSTTGISTIDINTLQGIFKIRFIK